MGIDITQWRIEIERCWKFAGRKRSRQKSKGVKTVTATTLLCKPLLALLLSFCLITAPSLLLQAGDVERNPGPLNQSGYSKLQCKRDTIIEHLANLGFTGELAEKLFRAETITRHVYDQAKNIAPGVVEVDRATVLFNAVLAGVKLNPAKYDEFIHILKQIRGSDDLVDFIEGQGIHKNSGAGNDQLESSSSTVTLPRSPELSTFGQCEQTAEDNGEALKPPTPTTHPPSTTAEQTLHSMPSEYAQEAVEDGQAKMTEAQRLQQATESVRTLHKALRDSQKKNEQLTHQMKEKQSTIEQLTRDIERHQKPIAEPQAANHDLRQELQQAQVEVEEKRHAPKPSTRQLQELDELQQTTTKVQQPPMKQNTIQDMKWDKESTAPETMFRGSAASDLNRAYFNGRGSTKIHSYDSDTQKWDELHIPDTPHIQHTLVMVKDLLTIVGGSSNGEATNSILSLTWDEKNRKFIWTSEFREMPSKRMNVAAICSGHSLIVAGGYDGAQILTVVEVLNASTQKWSRASPLPYPYGSATASICGESLFMLGGYDKPEQPTRLVLTCSISKLIESCQPQSPGVGRIWHRVVDSPFYFSSCATLCGELVLVGGFDDIANAETADIRAYNRRTDSWQTIGLGKMPAAQFRALAVVLRDKLMVVGGILSPRKYEKRFWGTLKDAVNILH